jgi:hypothetical protein
VYRHIPVNFKGVGPAFDVAQLVEAPLVDLGTPLLTAVYRHSVDPIKGAVISDRSQTLRHVYWGTKSTEALLSAMGGLTEEELDSQELVQVTKEARKCLEPYNFQGGMTGICKSFMGAASLRACPSMCTIKPRRESSLATGSHVALPLCFLHSDKLPHVLREKPMPCSLRELDVAVDQCRGNHSQLVDYHSA